MERFKMRLIIRWRRWHEGTMEGNDVICVSIVHSKQLCIQTCILCWCLHRIFRCGFFFFFLVLIHRQTRIHIEFFCSNKLNTAKEYLFLGTWTQLSVLASYPNCLWQSSWPVLTSSSQQLLSLTRNCCGPGAMPDGHLERYLFWSLRL